MRAQPRCNGAATTRLHLGKTHLQPRRFRVAPAESVGSWLAQQNSSTLGPWFTAAGYRTAFLGKTVNGAGDSVPSGWTFWGGFTNTGTYTYTDAVQVGRAAEGEPVLEEGA